MFEVRWIAAFRRQTDWINTKTRREESGVSACRQLRVPTAVFEESWCDPFAGFKRCRNGWLTRDNFWIARQSKTVTGVQKRVRKDGSHRLRYEAEV